MSDNHKRKLSQTGFLTPRVGVQSRKITGSTTGPSMSAFVYDTGRNSGGKLSHQVKYGPGIGFSPQERGQLHDHYSTKKVTQRYTQYNANRNTYVQAAQRMGRGLTLQERDVNAGRNPGSTSIDHIIASGTGQHAMNRTTLEFLKGGKQSGQGNLKNKFGGIAQQAAAIGRMRGLGREILREESRTEGYGSVVNGGSKSEHGAFIAKRNKMSKDISRAFERGDENAYKRFMKHTFDSTGNLRLGQGSGNSRVSTGFDMPLDSNLKPTQRGSRLLHAYKTFGYQDMITDGKIGKRNASGLFTTNLRGSNLSSSRQKHDDTIDHSRRFR